MRLRLLCFLLGFSLFANSSRGQSTRGTELWLTFGENLDLLFNGMPNFSVIVSSPVNTQGAVSIPFTGFSVPFIVSANQPVEVQLPQNIYYGTGDEAIFNFGVKITANNPVDVFAYHHRLYFSDASIVLPIDEMATEYTVMAQEDLSGNSPSEFVVLATRDSTVLEITPSDVTINFRPPNVPFNVRIDEGQTFQLQSYGDLTGSRVRVLSGGKVAVFGGARQAHVHCLGADNTLYDECYPIERSGKFYVTVPFLGQGGDIFRTLSLQDSCILSINGTTVTTLNRGEYFDTLLATASTFSSTKLILMSQFNKSQQCNSSMLGDPSMVNLVPLELKKEDVSWISLDGPSGQQYVSSHFVNILTATSGVNALQLDGNTVNFSPVPSLPGFSFARVAISSGPHRLTSPLGFQAVVYGFGDYNAHTFHLGYDDPDSPVGVLDFESDGTLVEWPEGGSVRITLSDALLALKGTLRLELFDATGRSCGSYPLDHRSVQRLQPELAAGIYLYRLTSDGEILTHGKGYLR